MSAQMPVDSEFLPPPLPNEVKGWGRFKRILFKFPIANLEVLGAIGFLGLGMWFIWPGNYFPTGGVLYSIYDGWTWVWGFVFFFLGIYKFWVILYRYETKHRFVVSFLALLAVWQVFLAYRRVSPHHAAVMVSLLAMVHQVWIVSRNGKRWNRSQQR
jgi:hypothetical protein